MVFKAPTKFLTERYEKDDQYYCIYDNYTPNYFKSAVTRKFYSIHEQPHLSTADPNIVDKIILIRDKGPKFKIPWPETSNQEYGWFIEPLNAVDRNDARFYHPRVVCEITKIPRAKKNK